MMLPMSFLLPGLAPDLAWTLGMDVPKDARASAQGLFNVMILGLGCLLANTICPYLGQQKFTHAGVTDFHGLFLVPMVCGLVAAVALALFFHPPKTPVPAAARH